MSVLVQIATASASHAKASSTPTAGTPSDAPTALAVAGVGVGDARQRGARDAAREQLGVHAADPPDADDRDPHHQLSRSETTSSQRPEAAERSSAAWTDTHASASSKPGLNGRRSATADAERGVLDRHQVLVADPVRAARHEGAVRREALAAEHGRVARAAVGGRPVEPQLVERLEVPAGRARRAVHVERHLALGPDDRAARLERAARAARELAQHAGVVLVRDRAVRVLRPAAAVVRAVAERALGDERRGGADHARDRPGEVVGEVDGMREQVGRDAVPALLLPEAPGQHAERVGPVHREEAAAVVGERAELARGDQLGGVAHERRPAVVEADAADHACAADRALGARGLLGRAADGLLAEHVLARLRGGLDQLDVEHVRRGDPHRVDVGVVDHPAPVGRPAREPERGDRLLGGARRGIRARHERRVVRAVAEQHRDARERARVRPPEPAEADHADADAAHRRRHAPSSWRSSSCVSWSSSAPPDIFFTISSRVISPRRQSPISRPRLRITKRSPTG